MKNPLNRRLPRELKSESGKYIVIFLFLTVTIGFVSGFLVADHSMGIAYANSFEDYNIEDGHFVLSEKMSDELYKKLGDEDINIYELFYKEQKVDNITYRIYTNRNEVDKLSLLQGHLAQRDDEIVIDRLFAKNNNIGLDSRIKIDGKDFTVCGLAAFSDYSALFQKNTDLMFNAQTFTVAAVTPTAFDNLSDNQLSYCYAWTYENQNLSEQEKHDKSEDLMALIVQNAVLTDFLAEPDNQAICFAGEDMGSDESMMIWLLYIVIVIMAFVFAVTTTNTIEKEANVIGTLRASGYTRNELVRHYLKLPVIVTFIGAVIGNILGYTIFKDIVVQLYYGSYSLPTYTTLWSAYAFVMTTVVPCVIMLLVNIFVLCQRLSLSPLKFLRRDLSRRKKNRVVRLPDFRFSDRFRLRILSQNFSSYIVMFVGIMFANIILLFGLMMTPLLEHYKTEINQNMASDYQYILKAPVETENTSAEKFAVTTLKTDFGTDYNEEITVYGIEENSQYFNLNFDDKNTVYIADGISSKYGIEVGDTLSLKSKYDNISYEFNVSGNYYYPATLAVFMDIDHFREVFDWESDTFSGYLSDKALTDIDETYIAATVTSADMEVFADQLLNSGGSMFPMVSAFAVLIYMLLVYLLSRIIIEKNAVSVSLIKILGYNNGEITRLYVVATALVVILSVGISLPVSYKIIDLIFAAFMSSYQGWIDLYVSPVLFLEMFLIGVVAYGIIGALQFLKVKRIPMEEALKSAE